MGDLVQRLRDYRSRNEYGDPVHHSIVEEAADRIEALTAERDALRSQNDALVRERTSMIATHRENRALAEKRHAAELASLRARVAEMEAIAPMSARLSPEYAQGYWAGFAYGERTTLRKLLRRGFLELFQTNASLSEPHT